MSDRNPPSPNLKRFLIFLQILPWLFIGAGGGALAYGVWTYRLARESVTWPHADGRIVSSEVETHSSKKSTTHGAEIRYEFTVNGTTVTGKRVAYGDYRSSDSSHAKEIVARYPAGKIVAVAYRPRDPTQCVLEPGVNGGLWLAPGIGLPIFLFGWIIMIPLYKTVAKVKRNLAAQTH
jgi:hypothetical protein